MTGPWIRLAVSFGVIISILWWTDAARVADHLLALDPGWVGLSILATTGATFSMAYRWQRTARALDIRFDFAFALREYYIAQLVNSVLPGGVPGDVARAVRARKQADLKLSAQSVAAERLLGQFAVMIVLIAGLSVSLFWPGGFDNHALSLTVLLVLFCAVIAMAALSRSITSIGSFVSLLFRLQSQTVFIVLGALSSACLILGFYSSARAVGTIIPAEGLVTVVPLILCAMVIPLSVAGWGWREGAAAALFPMIGASSSAGVAAGITYGAVILIAALPAAVLLLLPSAAEKHTSTGRTHSL